MGQFAAAAGLRCSTEAVAVGMAQGCKKLGAARPLPSPAPPPSPRAPLPCGGVPQKQASAGSPTWKTVWPPNWNQATK